MKKRKIGWEGSVRDERSTIDFFDSDNQKLTFRVGKVFFEGKNKPSKTGLWIWYQDLSSNKGVMGPVLVGKKSWEEIKQYIDENFEI